MRGSPDADDVAARRPPLDGPLDALLACGLAFISVIPAHPRLTSGRSARRLRFSAALRRVDRGPTAPRRLPTT